MAYIDTSDLESTYTTLEDLDNLLDDVNNDLKDINSNTNSEIRSNSQNIKVDNSKEQKDAVGEVLKSFEIGVEGISDSNLNAITNTTFSSNVFENSNIDSNLSSLSGEKFSSGDYSGFGVNSVMQNETSQVDMKYLREQYSDERIDSLPIEDEMKEALKKCLNNEDAESFYLVAEIINTQEQLKDSENEMTRIDDEIVKAVDISYKSEWCQKWCDENRSQSGKTGESGVYSAEEWSSAESAFDEYRTSLDSAARATKQNATTLRQSLTEKRAELSLMAYLPYYDAVSSTELEYNSNLFDTLPKDEMGLPLVSASKGSAEDSPNINYILDHLNRNGYQDFLLSLVDEKGNFVLDREGWIVTTACSEEYSPLSLMETVEKTLDYLEKNGMDINRDEVINNYNGAYGELERKAYKLLTIQERNVYEKLYHEDPDSAHAYLEAMEVTLNNRAGFENAKKIYEWYITGDDSFERVFNIGVVGVGGGVVGWAENAHAWITGDVTVTENEYTQQWFMQFVSTAFITADIGEINKESLSQLKNYQIGEDTEGKPVYLLDDTAYNNLLSKLNKGETLNSNDVLYECKCMDQETYEFMQSVYDSPDFQNFLKQQDGSKFLWGDEKYWGNQVYSAANSIGNMLPSILIGAALTPAGAAFTVGATTVTYGQIASNALMFLSSAGSSYKEAKRNGHTESDSRLYGAVSGVSELATGYLLGRIPFVSKISGVLEDFSASSHHVFVSAGLALLGDILGEVKEEVVQIFISGAAEYFILGEDVTWKDLYTQIPDTIVSTVISTGITNGVPTVIQLGKYSLRVTVQDAKQIASSSDPKKMITDLFFARFAPSKESQSLNNSNYTQEQIIYIASRLSSDESILNTVDLITSDEMKAEVISNIIDNDIKLEALSKLNTSEAKLTVAVTLSDDSAKIKALPMIENLEEQKVLISTISKENQQEAIDVVNSTTLETKNSETTTVVDTTSNVSELSENLEQINEEVIDIIQNEDTQLDSINETIEENSQIELEITKDLTEELSDIENVSLESNTEPKQISTPREFFGEHRGQGGDIGINQNIISRNSRCKINNLTEIQITNFELYLNDLGITDKEAIVLKLKNNKALTAEEFRIFYSYLYDVEFKDSSDIIQDINNYVDVNVQQTSSIYNDLQNKLVTKYGMSNIEAKMLLDLINSKGLGVCGYATVANAIVWFISQNDLEAQFNERFGFSIFNENGTINESELLLDMFMFFNSHFFTETDGSLKLNQSILMSNGMIDIDVVDQLLIDLGHTTYGYDYQNKEAHKNINSLLIEYFESKGMSFKTENILYSKKNLLEYNEFVTSITDLVNDAIDNGVSLNLAAWQFNLTRGGRSKNYSGGHSMYVIGISNDVDNPGIRVLTFGNEWVVPFSVLYEGMSEGYNFSLSTIEISTNIEEQRKGNSGKNIEIESINDDKQTGVRLNTKDHDSLTAYEFGTIESVFNSIIERQMIEQHSYQYSYNYAIKVLKEVLNKNRYDVVTNLNKARDNIKTVSNEAIQIYLNSLNNDRQSHELKIVECVFNSIIERQMSEHSYQYSYNYAINVLKEVLNKNRYDVVTNLNKARDNIKTVSNEAIQIYLNGLNNNQKTSQTVNQQSQTSIQNEVIDASSVSSNTDSQISSQETVSTQSEGIELITPQMEELSNQDNKEISSPDINVQEDVEVLETSIPTVEKNSQATQQSTQITVKDGCIYLTLPNGEIITEPTRIALKNYASAGHRDMNFLLSSNLANELTILTSLGVSFDYNKEINSNYASDEKYYIRLITSIIGCYQEMLKNGSKKSLSGLDRVDSVNGLNKDSAGFISTAKRDKNMKPEEHKTNLLGMFGKSNDALAVTVNTGNVLCIEMDDYNAISQEKGEILIAPFCKTSYNENSNTLIVTPIEYCKSDVTLEQILDERPKLAEALKNWDNLIKKRNSDKNYNDSVYVKTQTEIRIAELESEIATYKEHLKYYLMNVFVELEEAQTRKSISTRYVTINSDAQNTNLLNNNGSTYTLEIGTKSFSLTENQVKILENTFGKEWYNNVDLNTFKNMQVYLNELELKSQNYVHNEDGSAQIKIETDGKIQTINVPRALVSYLEEINSNWMYLSNEKINKMINEANEIISSCNIYEDSEGNKIWDIDFIKNNAGEKIVGISVEDSTYLYNKYGESLLKGKTIEEIKVILEQEGIKFKSYETILFNIDGLHQNVVLETDIINHLSELFGNNWSSEIKSIDQINKIKNAYNNADQEAQKQGFEIINKNQENDNLKDNIKIPNEKNSFVDKEVSTPKEEIEILETESSNRNETNIPAQLKDDIMEVLTDNGHTNIQKANDFLNSLSQDQIDEIQRNKDTIENNIEYTKGGSYDSQQYHEHLHYIVELKQLKRNILLMYEEFMQNQNSTNNTTTSTSTIQTSYSESGLNNVETFMS